MTEAGRSLSSANQVEILTPKVFEYFRTNFREMPVLSTNATNAVKMTAAMGDAPLGEVVKMLRQDPASAAAILRCANSALFRRSAEVASLNDAVVRIGRREVYNIVSSLALRSLFEPRLSSMVKLLPHHWLRLQHHAVVTAFGAAWLSDTIHVGRYETTFLGGMFHDVGKIIALYSLAGLILNKAVDFDISFSASAELMEKSHVDLGSEMLVHWGMPTYLIEICASHHDYLVAHDEATHEEQKPLHLIRMISCLDTLRENAYVPPTLDAELRHSIQVLQLNDRHLKLIASRLGSVSDYVSGLLQPKG